MASGVGIPFHFRVKVVPLKVYEPLVGASNLANLLDTSVGSVPSLNNSLLLKSLGVYSLAN